MTTLPQEFVDGCPVEGVFRMRGLEMTRIEVFVDAAFAFAVTMLVISFDAMPRSYEEMILAIKSIPAFTVSVIQLVWIWHAHNKWSRRFGLDTAMTVALSAALLIVVLIYVYPMRVMAGGMFSWLSNDYLPSNFESISLDELRHMFVFLGIGFIALSLVFVLLYRYAASLAQELRLTLNEVHETQTIQYMWLGAAGIGAMSAVLALVLPLPFVPYSGFVFVLLSVWFPFVVFLRTKSRP
jgi:hypothetical protein